MAERLCSDGWACLSPDCPCKDKPPRENPTRDVRRALLMRARSQRRWADTSHPSWSAHLGASLAYREAARMLRDA